MGSCKEKEKEEPVDTLPEGMNVPGEFFRIISDFIVDIVTTFPEYKMIIERWWKKTDFSDIIDEVEREQHISKENNKNTIYVFKHCLKIIPERFFDILYKNKEIFDENSEYNTEFLPGIVFKQLWNCDISDNTRETIWKYLQLILFAVIGSVHSTSELGDSAKLFEAINEDELKAKLEETFEGMKNLFTDFNIDESSNNDENGENEGNGGIGGKEGKEGFQIPNPNDIHNHINEMMGGKLGKLAMELAEETADEMNLDMENMTTSQEVFQKLFSNPGKLMEMVKNVGGKIDEKIKSGELKESELMSEGVEILNKMKQMPGMENMASMFSKLGIPGLGKGAKLNTAAMESQLQKNLKMAQMKERMKTKIAQKKENSKLSTSNVSNSSINSSSANSLTDEQIISIFSTGEKVDKTPRGSKPKENKDRKENKDSKDSKDSKDIKENKDKKEKKDKKKK